MLSGDKIRNHITYTEVSKIYRNTHPRSALINKLGSTRTRWKVLGLTYAKLGTSGRWVGTRTGTGVTSILVKSFFGRSPLSHGLRPKKLHHARSVGITIAPVRVLPNGRSSRVGCRQDRELFTWFTYMPRCIGDTQLEHLFYSGMQMHGININNKIHMS